MREFSRFLVGMVITSIKLRLSLLSEVLIMHKDKFVKGHFKASCNFQSADGKHFVGFGDEFDVSEVLKDNRVEIRHNNESFMFDMSNFEGTFIPFDKE